MPFADEKNTNALEKLEDERRTQEVQNTIASLQSIFFILSQKKNTAFTIDSKCSIYTCRNRRATATLSPVLIHFLSPSSYLSQKLQLALTQLRANSNIPLPLATERRQISSLPSPVEDTGETVQAEQADPYLDGQTQREEPSIDESAEVKIARAYEAIAAERVARQESKPISARELALRAKVRRSTCSEWLQQQEEHHPLGDESQDEGK